MDEMSGFQDWENVQSARGFAPLFQPAEALHPPEKRVNNRIVDSIELPRECRPQRYRQRWLAETGGFSELADGSWQQTAPNSASISIIYPHQLSLTYMLTDEKKTSVLHRVRKQKTTLPSPRWPKRDSTRRPQQWLLKPTYLVKNDN